jgi:hypothetical protein
VSSGRRLATIEDRLTPAEAVISWSREAYRHKSLSAQVAWLRCHPEEAWPLEHLPTQVSRAARALAKGEPHDQVHTKMLKAERNVVFLFLLHQFTNLLVARELETQSRRAERIFEMLGELVQLGCLRDELCRERLTEQHPDLLALETDVAERHRTLAARCLLAAREAFLRLRALEAATEHLAHSYLQDKDLLFPDLRSGVAILLHTLSEELRLAAAHTAEGHLQYEGELVRLLTRQALGETQAAARPAVRPEGANEEPSPDEAAAALARRIVIRARAETLHLLGDSAGSQALLVQYLDASRAIDAPARALDKDQRSGAPPKPRDRKAPAAPDDIRVASRANATSKSAKTPIVR